MTNQEITSQILHIRQQIASLQGQIDKANVEKEKYKEKRDQLNEKGKDINHQIREMKLHRDQINEKVRLLKQKRNEIRVKIQPIIEQIKLIREKKGALKETAPRVRQEELQDELDAIEWKIQTTSLDLQEEKRLIDEVKRLETHLSGFKKIEKQNKKIEELQIEAKKFQTEADIIHKELTELAQKSQDIHTTVLEKIEEAKKCRIEADAKHNEYKQTREHTQQWLVDIAVLTGQLKGLENSIREQRKIIREKEDAARTDRLEQLEQERVRKTMDEQTLKRTLETQAREKLERGEQLSWNEFQLLTEDEEKDTQTQD
jgi:uncharacterized coiled-coil DUF342 family protein